MADVALGVVIFPTDQSIGAVELAREAEARGFESLWFPEHTHIPTSRTTPCPGGEPLPEHYRRTLDPFVALSAAAAVTTDAEAGHRHLPRRPARPDRPGQGGRLARLPVAAAASCSASVSAGTSTRWSTTASTRASAGTSCGRRSSPCSGLWTEEAGRVRGRARPLLAELVVAEARRSSRTRRSSWVAPAARSRSATSSSTATAGCRSTAARTSCPSSPSCGRPPRRPAATRPRSSLGVFGVPGQARDPRGLRRQRLHPARARSAPGRRRRGAGRPRPATPRWSSRCRLDDPGRDSDRAAVAGAEGAVRCRGRPILAGTARRRSAWPGRSCSCGWLRGRRCGRRCAIRPSRCS